MKEPLRIPVYKETGIPVKVGDKVPGKRLEKLYAHVVAIHADSVELLYNGECRNRTVALHVIDATVAPLAGHTVQQILNSIINVLVEVRDHRGKVAGTGRIQTVAKDECTIDDLNGGAFFFHIDRVKSVLVEVGQPALIVITKPA